MLFPFVANNRIKTMTTEQFQNLLKSLEIVELTSNECIDGIFSGETEIRGMISRIEESCHFELPKNNSNEVLCEEISRSEFGIRCLIGTDTKIISRGYKILSTNYPRIQSLEISVYKRFDRVVEVRYLPVVSSFIRNLISYRVDNAAVRAIGKENFEGMIWLEILTLRNTLIKTLPENTFQGLLRLKYIELGK